MPSSLFDEAINTWNMARYSKSMSDNNECKHLSVSSSGISLESTYMHRYSAMNNDAISRDDRESVRVALNNYLSSNSTPRPSLSSFDVEEKLPQHSSCQPNDEQRLTFPLKRIRFVDDESYTKCNHPKKVDTEKVRHARETYLSSHMDALQEKIQKAACFELRCLQSLEEVKQKRMRWEEKHREALSRRPPTNSESETDVLESYISEANGKIAKAMKVEFAYKRRVKELHDKRYRWSMLYESAGRELLELDPSRSIPPLPPLFPPSFSRQ